MPPVLLGNRICSAEGLYLYRCPRSPGPAAVAAARQLVRSVDAAAEQRTPVTVEKRAEFRAAMSHAANAGREVIEAVYEPGPARSRLGVAPVPRNPCVS
ncbi:hypothetical protein GCM10010464_02950 [Pseudonocardia yunnanensis]